MGFDVQKANMLKRISAGILDFILLLVLSVGCAVIISLICDFDGHIKAYNGYIDQYQQEFGIDFSFVDSDDFKAMTEEEQTAYKEKCQQAYDALNANSAAVKEYGLVMSLTLVIITFGILIAYLILEFILPLIFKNGQTIGKKAFGIAVMHTNCVKINSVALFIRSILGKYVIETMIPVLICIMIYFGTIGFVAVIVLAGILILEIIVFFVSKNRSLIHDVLAKTVTVDLASQMIYATQEEAVEAKQLAVAEDKVGYVPGAFSFGKTTDGKELEKNDAQDQMVITAPGVLMPADESDNISENDVNIDEINEIGAENVDGDVNDDNAESGEDVKLTDVEESTQQSNEVAEDAEQKLK